MTLFVHTRIGGPAGRRSPESAETVLVLDPLIRGPAGQEKRGGGGPATENVAGNRGFLAAARRCGPSGVLGGRGQST